MGKEELKEEELKESSKDDSEQEENLKEKVKELEEKVKKLEQIARASNSRAVELQREIDYLKERYRRDLEEQRKYGYERFALDILEILDNFERALEMGKLSSEASSIIQGVEMIYRELKRILEKHHIQEIEVEGKEFDPYMAEAVETQPSSEVPPNTVVRVIRKGYKLHEKVIRPARVVVSVSEEEIT
jgi:molecular chaperone GrpE